MLELVRDRLRHPTAVVGVDLCLTEVVRAGERSPIPAGACEQLCVGDRLIGRYRGRDRGETQLVIRRRPLAAVASERPARLSLASTSDDNHADTWELDTRNMSPGRYRLLLRGRQHELGQAEVGLDFRLVARPESTLTLGERAVAITG